MLLKFNVIIYVDDVFILEAENFISECETAATHHFAKMFPTFSNLKITYKGVFYGSYLNKMMNENKLSLRAGYDLAEHEFFTPEQIKAIPDKSFESGMFRRSGTTREIKAFRDSL